MGRPGSSSIAGAGLCGPTSIDGDYQDGKALEFGGRKNWSSLVKKALAAGRVTGD
jgi:hypothetical protein